MFEKSLIAFSAVDLNFMASPTRVSSHAESLSDLVLMWKMLAKLA